MYCLTEIDEQIKQYFFLKGKTEPNFSVDCFYRGSEHIAASVNDGATKILYLFGDLTRDEQSIFFPLEKMVGTDIQILGEAHACENIIKYLGGNYCEVRTKDISVLATDGMSDSFHFNENLICDGNYRSVFSMLNEIKQWKVAEEDMTEIQKQLIAGNHEVKIIYEDDQIVSLAHCEKVTSDIGVLKYLVSVDECYLKNIKQLLHYFLKRARNEGVAHICVYNTNIPMKLYESFGFRRMKISQLEQKV